MKVCCISDLHGQLPEIEPCDLLIIAGDVCPHAGTVKTIKFGREVYERVPVGSRDDIFFQMKWLLGPFKDWLESVPAKEIVAVWGNHDWIAERSPEMIPKSLRWHILHDNAAEILGLKIWGSPFQPYFYNWAFNAPYGAEGEEFLARKWSLIPENTDIVIVHGPPHGYGDVADGERVGSKSLTDAIMKLKPKLMVCGHIHSGHGEWKFSRGDAGEGIICNASILDEEYEMVYKPFYMTI